MNSKKCSRCKEVKPLSEFHKDSSTSTGHRSHCKQCRAATQHPNSKPFPSKYFEKHKHSKRQFVWNYLETHPCVDCGETNPLLLEFDHREGVEKVAKVSDLMTSKGSLTTLVAEIDKCDVRCTSCHRIKTARDRRYYAKFIDWDDPEDFTAYLTSTRK